MINPYDTSYGKLINITKVIAALTRYININDLDELEYEYPSTSESRNVFITGFNEEEKELPVWEHPIVIKTLKGVSVVVTDVRKYVKPEDSISVTLEDISRDANSLNFMIIRTLLTKDFIDGTIGKHRTVFKPTTTAMGVWLSGMINNIVTLTPIEAFNVEIITAMYANTLYYNKDDVRKNLDTIVARVIGSKHTYKFAKKDVKELCESYQLIEGSKTEELIVNVQNMLSDDKKQFITHDSVVGIMGNVWYGPGTSETPIIALENMPTWLSLLYSVITNRSYSKSRLGTLLNKHSRVIDAKAIQKHFENYLKETKL